MRLSKANLPDAVEVDGKFYPIQTGHSFWFRFSEILGQDKILLTDADYLYLDEKPEDRQAGFNELANFFYEESELPRGTGSSERVLDYEIDSDFLYAGILQCYGVDLFEKQYHWHKVRAMIAGLTGTKLNEIISIRCWSDTKNKEMMQAKNSWSLPRKISATEKKKLEKFKNLFYDT